MENKYFNKIEEKYVFNISLIFWRIIVGVGAVAALVGLLMLLWGFFPPFKQSVRKPKYPSPVKVTPSEINIKLNPPKKLTKQPPGDNEIQIQETPQEPAPGEEQYLALLDSLKKLIPPENYQWKTKGRWDYPYGKSYWDRYKNSRYRNWVVTHLGITDRLKAAYNRTNAEAFTDKKTMLDAYISTIALFPEDKRERVLKALCLYTIESVPLSEKNTVELQKSVSHFSKNEIGYLEKLATFGKKNPNDGFSFIEYVNQTIGKFDSTAREGVLDVMIDNYYSHFKYINKQIESTNLFLPIIADFDSTQQAKALIHYYGLFVSKNENREREIQEINYKYEGELSHAEMNYRNKKSKKSEIRRNGLYGFGAGITLIAILALILVSLSIQRSLKRIENTFTQANNDMEKIPGTN
jgi:hypothetical protein